MFTMSGQRLGLTTYYRTISVDNKPTTVIIGPSKKSFYYLPMYLLKIDLGVLDNLIQGLTNRGTVLNLILGKTL